MNTLGIAMKFFMRFTLAMGVTVLFWFLFPYEAYAYIDPGTGSYMFQMMIGFLVGALFAAKLFWQRIRNFLSRLFFRQEQSENNER